jgi:hypothetical protein
MPDPSTPPQETDERPQGCLGCLVDGRDHTCGFIDPLVGPWSVGPWS